MRSPFQSSFLVAAALVAFGAHAAPASPDCAAFAADLSAMVSADQALRSRWDLSAGPAAGSEPPRIVQQTEIVDRQNALRLKRWIEACGWPKRSVYGPAAVNDAWLLVQHADHDHAFQHAVLQRLQEAVAEGEAPAGQLAYLADRVAVAEGKGQPYGTQLNITAACEVEFFPLDDRAKVEVRRKAIGLPPLEEYRQIVRQNALPPNCGSK